MYVLLKALPPVCMKYATQGESQVTNIAWGEACQRLSPRAVNILLYKWNDSDRINKWCSLIKMSP